MAKTRLLSTMFLTCSNITFKYPNTEQFVFKHLSYQMATPGFHSLFGPSGVGKTSLAKIITGDIRGYSGEVVTQNTPKLYYTYNLERLPDWSSIGNHLTKITHPSRKQRAQDLVELFGIEDVMDQRFSQLSLGQQNRINLLRYLVQDFDLLIMDESLGNVDEITREKIILGIKHMFPASYFLYISHNIVEVATFCDDILVFRSTHKQPQAILIKGQNQPAGGTVSKEGRESTMLEIMNAS